MKRVITICLLLAQIAGMAADNHRAELLCVWNYKTLYKTAPNPFNSGETERTVVQLYYFFSDQSYVCTGANVAYDDVLKMKEADPKRWMTVDNNLVLFNEKDKQVMGVVSKENQPVGNLLKGPKEISLVVITKSGTVPEPYNDVLAFSPQ
jgi:hypothetical protein